MRDVWEEAHRMRLVGGQDGLQKSNWGATAYSGRDEILVFAISAAGGESSGRGSSAKLRQATFYTQRHKHHAALQSLAVTGEHLKTRKKNLRKQLRLQSHCPASNRKCWQDESVINKSPGRAAIAPTNKSHRLKMPIPTITTLVSIDSTMGRFKGGQTQACAGTTENRILLGDCS